MRIKTTLLVLSLLAALALVGEPGGLFSIVKSTALLGRQPAGFYLLPTSQLLQPWGEQTVIKGRPVDLAFDAGRRRLAVLNSRSVLLIDPVTGARTGEVKSKSTSY